MGLVGTRSVSWRWCGTKAWKSPRISSIWPHWSMASCHKSYIFRGLFLSSAKTDLSLQNFRNIYSKCKTAPLYLRPKTQSLSLERDFANWNKQFRKEAAEERPLVSRGCSGTFTVCSHITNTLTIWVYPTKLSLAYRIQDVQNIRGKLQYVFVPIIRGNFKYTFLSQ